MVGIVIVAHSSELAESVVALARQMLREDVPMTAAGGVDDPEHPYGTDVSKIVQAVESVYSDDGVLILMDMGSAILSAETALDFLPKERRGRVRLSEAPLIEGAVAAAVCSEGGGRLEEVEREARGALQGKSAQLGVDILAPEPPTERVQGGTSAGEARMAKDCRVQGGTSAGEAREIHLTVRNPLGIHARPAAWLVFTASRFRSTVTVRNVSRGSGAVNARSINQIALLGVQQGDEIALCASGPDADNALEELAALVQNGFGESERRIEMTTAVHHAGAGVEKNELAGTAVSPGIAIAPMRFFKPHVDEIPHRTPQEPEAEWEKLCRAIDAVKAEIQGMRERVAAGAGDSEASIFDAHLLSLDDEELLRSAHLHIFSGRMSAEQAWSASVGELLESYAELDSTYQRERGCDLTDLKGQVLSMIMGSQPKTFEVEGESVVVAADLSPSDIARFDTSKVTGLCMAYGGPTAHSAILATALGIPAVVRLGPAILRVPEGTMLAVDGKMGRVWVNPEHPSRFRDRRSRWLKSRTESAVPMQGRAVTLDGRKITVAANISSVLEVDRALKLGAEGVGVLRTEFLFIGRSEAPSEEEQARVYRSIADGLGGYPLIVRTLDAGGDKPLAYIPMEAELNPFLGVRGLRLSLERPDLFVVQLRAILRASPGRKIGILLPMVSSVEEIREAKRYLEEAKQQLRASKIPFNEEVRLGIMVEVPAAALIAERLVEEVDFMSIGTNDLSQYVLSADRSGERVSSLCDALHPAVLRLIRQTVSACHAAGKQAGVCGEVAGDRNAVPVLLGLGVDELSMNPLYIPQVKKTISRLSYKKASALAEEALDLAHAGEVRELISQKARILYD